MRTLMLKTWRDITTRKGQFAALIVLVTLGIASYVAFVGASEDLKASRARAYEELRFEDLDVTVNGAPSSVVRELREIPGVHEVEGRLVVDTGMEVEGEQGSARIVGLPADRRPHVNDVLVEEGRYLKPGEQLTGLINVKFATDSGFRPGDRLLVRFDGHKRDVRIVGVASSAEYMFPVRRKDEIPTGKGLVILFMDQHEVERLFGSPDTCTSFAFTLEPGADLDRVIDDAEEILEPYDVIASTPRADQPSHFGLASEINQNETIAGLAPLLVLSISSLSLYIALARLVRSQRGEIGLAKALGYGNGAILTHYLMFALFIAITGSTIGFIAGFALGNEIVREYTSLLGVPYLVHAIRPHIALSAIGMSAGACLLAGLAPAIASARLRPAEAMHADPNLSLSGGHVPLVERVFGWAMPRSFTFRIPLRNIFRARRRSLSTVVGIAVAVLLSVATLSMFDSIDYALDNYFTKTETWDAMAGFEQPFGDALVREVGDWEQVTAVQAALAVPVDFRANGVEHEGAVTAVPADAWFHGFNVVEGSPVASTLNNGGLVVSRTLANKLDVGVGDTVRVDSPYIDKEIAIDVGTIIDEMMGTPVFTGLGRGNELTGGGSRLYNVLYLQLESGAKEGRVRADLYDLPGVATAQVKARLVAEIEQMMSFTNFFFAVMLGFGLTMAFVVVYNTFTANVLERTREIASMRTIGESGSRLAVMVTIENLLLSVVGMPLGLWLGVLISDALLKEMMSEAYSFPAVLLPQTTALVVVLMLAVVLLSQVPPIRRIARLDLAEATKMRE